MKHLGLLVMSEDNGPLEPDVKILSSGQLELVLKSASNGRQVLVVMILGND